jgi:hypothetical protein
VNAIAAFAFLHLGYGAVSQLDAENLITNSRATRNCRAAARPIRKPTERQPGACRLLRFGFGVRQMPDQILVLVAKDEERVRFVVLEALHDAGFEVLEAGRAEEALAHPRPRPATINLLFH